MVNSDSVGLPSRWVPHCVVLFWLVSMLQMGEWICAVRHSNQDDVSGLI